MKAYPDKFKFSVSHTTRAIRPGEKHEENYYYVETDKFLQMVIKEEFVEHNKYNGNYYGTSKAELERISAQGNIDINGAKKLYDKGYKANYIGILPPSIETLRERLKKRQTETTDQITKRLELSQEEINEINSSPFFSQRIVNDDFETGLKDFKNAVLSLYPHLRGDSNSQEKSVQDK